jgi:cytochrome c oxidase subunit I
MQTNSFTLDIPQSSQRFTTAWLILALSSIGIGGLFVVLIVLSRTPYIQDVFPLIDFFKTALVIHVDMTVLVWFLSFAAVFWSLRNSDCPKCSWVAFYIAVAGTIVMALSPFLGASKPLMNNYVPILQSPVFYVGLGLFAIGFALAVLKGLIFPHQVMENENDQSKALHFGLMMALVTAFISLIAFIWSYLGMPAEIVSEEAYFELLFWGSGHVIQFTHTQLMLIAWLWLASVSGVTFSATPRLLIMLFFIGILPTLVTPYIYFMHGVASPEYILYFSWMMIYGGGLVALPLGLILAKSVYDSRRSLKGGLEFSSLQFSVLLFMVGGIIGFNISGSNTIVPAHYHGSIGGITMAFMGMTYYFVPRLGFDKIRGKLARWQPAIYCTGQLMHVTGLAWSGGHGVQRKTAGSDQGLEGFQQIAGMGLMGLGGMIAIIGGIIFLVVVYQAMRRGKQ